MSDAESQARARGDRRDAASFAEDLEEVVREFSSRVQRVAQELRQLRGMLEAAAATSDPADAR
jgi:hypothetical protein